MGFRSREAKGFTRTESVGGGVRSRRPEGLLDRPGAGSTRPVYIVVERTLIIDRVAGIELPEIPFKNQDAALVTR